MNNNNASVIPTGKFIARIDEERCIGCTLCIKACPFDAIIGASKYMHTVITQYCTGCKLCIHPCPVDCINIETNTYFKEVCESISSDQQRELKKVFAACLRSNKKQRTLRLKHIKQANQTAFERKKNELLNRQNKIF